MAGTVVPSPRAFHGDELIPLSMAARRVGRTVETLKTWHRKFGVPAVIDPGGDWLGYQSWVDAVLSSARPGKAANMADITNRWWRDRGIEPMREVA